MTILQEKIKQSNINWSYIPDRLYSIVIIGGSESGKTNVLLNLITYQLDVDEMYLYAKNPEEENINFELTNVKYP